MDERGLRRPHGAAGHGEAASVHCAECDTSSGLRWRGWRGYRVDDPETDELPSLAFYCPACAEREFGASKRRSF
ncbi:MAG: hypothetical protein H0X39_09200 [Actinobacteria bacterium]|nr:hypothetical protein [Actinomycetota bacterium]